MTSAKANIKPETRYWEPYPELSKRPKDMQQIRPIDYLQDMFVSILTPGYSYRDHPTTLIGREIPIYYDPTAPVSRSGSAPPHVIPDCMVAFDVDTAAIWRRVGYDPVQNAKPPDFVMEVASHRTYRRDMLYKRDLYERIGVLEYWRFDPEGGRYYGRPIIGERLVDGRYEEFPQVERADGTVGVTSALLNLDFRWDGRRFRVHDPATGEEYEHWQQVNTRLTDTNTRLTDANTRLTAAKDRLTEENARLMAEIQRLREERTNHAEQ